MLHFGTRASVYASVLRGIVSQTSDPRIRCLQLSSRLWVTIENEVSRQRSLSYASQVSSASTAETGAETESATATEIPKSSSQRGLKSSRNSVRMRLKSRETAYKGREPKSWAFADHDADTFGSLAEGCYPSRTGAELLPEEEDDEPAVFEQLDRAKVWEYEKEIKDLVREKRIKDALNRFFEIQKVYGVKPTHSMFTMLIGGCGRVGYTKMAFKLFKMMRDRNMDPTPATLTGLFNSCAEGPFPELGLERARILRERIKLKNWVPSNITYHAMIKAFGVCGDLQAAFEVMDEMAEQKHAITADTFAFLLMACISDKEAGFSLGLKVMRTMLWKKIRPSVHCYNLFLRTVRDCGIGPPEVFQELLDSARPKKKLTDKQKITEKEMLRIEAQVHNNDDIAAAAKEAYHMEGRQESTQEMPDSDRTAVPESSASSSLAPLPNLLAPTFQHKGDIVGLGQVTEPYHRLLMCGGVAGLMDHFRDMCIRPDAKTTTLLLDCLPQNCAAEAELIAEVDKMGVALDVDFFNMLIKRRALRGDKEAARDVLALLTDRSLNPDVVTFGVLALSIHSKKEVKEFLESMKVAGLRVNEETWSTLVNNACFKFNFWLLLELMYFAKCEDILVNVAALQHIGKAKDKMRQILLKKERGLPSKFATPAAESGYAKFCEVYESWLKEVKVEEPRHPWEQYEPENMRKSYTELKAAAALIPKQT